MYYRLDVDLGRMNTRVQTASNEGTSLCSGLLIEEGGLELPFRCEMLVDPDLGHDPLIQAFDVLPLD